MNWILLAAIGHLANGVAFGIDKILLRSAFRRSATYAGLVGLLSALVLFAVPFVPVFPRGDTWFLSISSGVTFIFALWAFFAALARAEASRIVPIVGSLIPLLTLVGTFVFLGERLTDVMFLGFGFLILATFLLSHGGKGRPTSDALWLAVTSAVFFAISSITAKATYDAAGFFAGFVTSRLAAGMTALCLLTVIDRRAGREVLQIMRIKTREHVPPSQSNAYRRSQWRAGARGGTSKHEKTRMAMLVIFGQGLGAVGFLFVQWAIAIGSAAIVNAMQAIQYALLVILAFALRHKAPQLLGEELTQKAIARKTIALIIAAVGMYLVI